MAERISYAEKFNKILVQIDELAQASGCPAPKIFDEHCAMTTATFPNAIVPLIINTTAFLLIAVTKGSRKTVMPAVTGCTLPAATVYVRKTPPSLIPESAEAQPPTAAATRQTATTPSPATNVTASVRKVSAVLALRTARPIITTTKTTDVKTGPFATAADVFDFSDKHENPLIQIFLQVRPGAVKAS